MLLITWQKQIIDIWNLKVLLLMPITANDNKGMYSVGLNK